MNRLKKIVFFLMMTMLFGIITGCGTKIESGKRQEIKQEQERTSNCRTTKEIVEKYGVEQEQKLVVDDVEIALQKMYYSEKCSQGYLEFYVVKNGGKDKVNYQDDEAGYPFECFGGEQKYLFQYDIIGNGSISSSMTFEEDGNNLYVYLEIDVPCDKLEQKLYLLKAGNVFDLDVEDALGYFELKNTAVNNQFTADNGDYVILSNTVIEVWKRTEVSADNISIDVHINDGSNINLIEKGDYLFEIKGNLISKKDSGWNLCRLILDEYIEEFDNAEYVIVDGEKYVK